MSDSPDQSNKTELEESLSAINKLLPIDDVEAVLTKIAETMPHEEPDNESLAAEEVAAEMGDLLFAVASWARWLKVEPEGALREANRRFYDRFTHVERAARAQGRSLDEMSLEELDALWEAAKKATGPQ